MKFLAKKYLSELSVKDEYILDDVILMHAWKKAHHSIRSTNWYADIFELDCSAIELGTNVKKWQKALKSESFKFMPLKLIPAPKTESWGFDKEKKFRWQPCKNSLKTSSETNLTKALRPLAHVDIEAQTIMTALMMLLANKVETIQGDTSLDFNEVHERGVVNYGNRLYCHYFDNKASFLWGNSATYNQYFKDYQQFLARPIYFGKKAKSTAIESEVIYEVHLDLEKFYDKVKRKLLIKKIKRAVDLTRPDPVINRVFTAFEKWDWEGGVNKLYGDVCANDSTAKLKPPLGIPQGLVAGGFLSNIYLLHFDKVMNDQINSSFKDEKSIFLVDYCRYVDDMRLIIKANRADLSGKQLEDKIKDFIEKNINKKLPEDLCLNNEKTFIERFSLKTLGISHTLKDIQTKISGPLSESSVDEQLGHLEGLIGLAESLRDKGASNDNTNPLARIESPMLDVREDTLLRFTANKIHKLLQQKRSLIAQEVDENGKPIAGNWDYLQERMARRFIAAWSKDPSLIVLLKKGLELFPDPKILTPILSQLMEVLNRKQKKQCQVAIFCIGEIFRHAAMVIHAKNRWAIPAQADVEIFFGILLNKSVFFIQNYEGKSRFNALISQAKLLCLVKNDTPFEVETGDVRFNIISKMMKGYRAIAGIKNDSFFMDALLAYKLANNKTDVIKSISHALNKEDNTNAENKVFCIKLITEAPLVFQELFFYAKKYEKTWVTDLKIQCLVRQSGVEQQAYRGELKELNDQDVSLLSIVKRPDNPFSHENAILTLVLNLLKKPTNFDVDFDFINTKVNCSDWSDLQSLKPNLECELEQQEHGGVSLFFMPSWVKKEHKPFYRLGMFIRSCLLGSVDWTQNSFSNITSNTYSGIKTSFIKRQVGMMQSPESFHGDVSPTSSWLADLLFFLLQHPGIQFSEEHCFSVIKDWSSLQKVIENRVKEQKQLFCSLSGIPSYIEKVNLNWKDSKKKSLKVVMVQSLLPYKKDFGENGLKLDNPKYRAKHRRHVASVAELLLHKIYSQNTVQKGHSKKIDTDLIVWPELAVHRDDMDILERLSDKTGAIILTGITFLDLKGIKGPNNVAMWLIPNKKENGRQFIKRLQGKEHLMKDEKSQACSWRPYQLIVELSHPAFQSQQGFRLTSSICYDATDLKISADLKDKTDAYIIPALNKDVATFDNMVDALYYHMYQHVVLVNTGEFGGSVAKAPYSGHDKLITHVHGVEQVSISSFDMNMFDFREVGAGYKSDKSVKTRPAGS